MKVRIECFIVDSFGWWWYWMGCCDGWWIVGVVWWIFDEMRRMSDDEEERRENWSMKKRELWRVVIMVDCWVISRSVLMVLSGNCEFWVSIM